jgi:hypothetical protein
VRILAWAALSAACAAAPPRPEHPTVGARQAMLADTVDGGLDVVVRLDVVNRGRVSQELAAVDWELAVDERPVARGRDDARLELRAGGNAEARFSAHVKPGAAARVRSLPGAITFSGVLHWQSRSGDVATTFTLPVSAAR